MNTDIHLWQYLAELILEWEMFQTNRAVYTIMWKNVVESDRPEMAI